MHPSVRKFLLWTLTSTVCLENRFTNNGMCRCHKGLGLHLFMQSSRYWQFTNRNFQLPCCHDIYKHWLQLWVHSQLCCMYIYSCNSFTVAAARSNAVITTSFNGLVRTLNFSYNRWTPEYIKANLQTMY